MQVLTPPHIPSNRPPLLINHQIHQHPPSPSPKTNYSLSNTIQTTHCVHVGTLSKLIWIRPRKLIQHSAPTDDTTAPSSLNTQPTIIRATSSLGSGMTGINTKMIRTTILLMVIGFYSHHTSTPTQINTSNGLPTSNFTIPAMYS